MRKAAARRRLLALSLGVIVVWIAAALAAPRLASYSPYEPDLFAITQPASAEHLLGTDELGRDVLARLLYGARVSLAVGMLSAVLSTLLGVWIGVSAGLSGGWLDAALMRLVDLFLCVPNILVLMLIFALIPATPALIILFLGATGWMGLARVARNAALSLKSREFVEASRALGSGHPGIVLRHILPNIASLVGVSATLTVAYNIVAEGTLSFLGYGIPSTTPSWGNMLTSAQSFYLQAPQLTIVPGIALMITVIAFNALGNALSLSR